MTLTAIDVLQARDALAEYRWKLWDGEEAPNEAGVSLTRFVAGINETRLDMLLEFLRRFGSVKNQHDYDVLASGTTLPDADGTYSASGLAANGYTIFRSADAAFEFRVAVDTETGGYQWQLIQLSDGAIIWAGAAGAVNEVAPYDGLDVASEWLATDDGVLVPVDLAADAVSLSAAVWTAGAGVTGDLSVDWDVPNTGTLFRSVTDPQVNNGKVREGEWRIGAQRPGKDFDGRYGAKGSWVIVQELHLELNTSAPITEGATRWRIKGGKDYKSGSRNLVLELPYCDPSYVQAMAEENTETVYDSAIYTVNGGLLAGKWYRVDAMTEIDAKTGYGTILWFLRNHDNEDFRFVYKANANETHVHFFKLHMPSDGIADFHAHYYFDPSGNFYVSTNGSTYTAMNGEAATGSLPVDAKLLTVEVAGRTVPGYGPVPRDEAGEIDLHIQLVFAEDGITYEAVIGSRKYYIGIAVEKEPKSVNDPAYVAGIHTGIALGADNEAQASVSYDKETGRWSWQIVEQTAKVVTGEGALGGAISVFGDPENEIQLWVYRGLAKANVPSPGKGYYSNNGKTKTVTQIELSVDEATLTWNVVKRVVTITAAVDPGDPADQGWFYGGGEISCERDSRMIRTWGLTNDGNNWFTFSPEYTPWKNGGWYDLNFFYLSMARWRAKRAAIAVNHFVRRPTISDLASIGLAVSNGHIHSLYDTATDDREKITIAGRDTDWAVVKVTVEMGTFARDDSNHPDRNMIAMSKIKYTAEPDDKVAASPYVRRPDFDYPDAAVAWPG